MSEDEAKRTGAIGALTDLGGKLVGALPPVFIMLCLINVMFLGMVMFFLSDQIDRRTALVTQIVTRCLDVK